jgi:hypothetical protein
MVHSKPVPGTNVPIRQRVTVPGYYGIGGARYISTRQLNIINCLFHFSLYGSKVSLNGSRVSFRDSRVRFRGSRVGLMGLGQASVARVSSKTADLAAQDRHLGSS